MSMEMSKKKPRLKKADRAVLLLVSLVLVLSAAIGGTLGYLTGQVNVVNTMEAGTIGTTIEEKFDGTVKENVTVKNTGNSDAYIRAVVVVTWQDKDGNVLPVSSDDYVMNQDDINWKKSDDGFWYYNGVVGENESTTNLINTCKVAEGVTPPEGYNLTVEILASAIQAEPAQAVQDAWKMQYQDDGGWTSANGN